MASASFWNLVESQTARSSSQHGLNTSMFKRNCFRMIRYINTCARKLQMKAITKATACWLFHKFFKAGRFEEYDEYLVAMTCMFTASKVEEQHIKMRDIINVAYRTLHTDSAPLKLDSTYYKLVESLIDFEVFLCRMLQFKLIVEHPHKYLLHYLKSLRAWIGEDNTPYVQLSWSLLNDAYYTDICLYHQPDMIAVAICYISIQVYGVQVPLEEHAETQWWNVFVEDASQRAIESLGEQILEVYQLEKSVTPSDAALEKDSSGSSVQTAH